MGTLPAPKSVSGITLLLTVQRRTLSPIPWLYPWEKLEIRSSHMPSERETNTMRRNSATSPRPCHLENSRCSGNINCTKKVKSMII